MEKTLIILGNGFDLDLGWKTSYNNFYLAEHRSFERFNQMPYIRDLILGEYWFNLEEYIRDSLTQITEKRIEEMFDFWQICRSSMSDYFINNKKLNIFQTNKDSCAYKFLLNISEKSDIVSFNYTNPFTKNNIPEKEIEFVHGGGENIIDYTSLKLGVDNRVLEENPISNNPSILPIIKTYNNRHINNVLLKLKTHQNIIFYGHSLGIADADYFQSYFKSIISKSLNNQNIYFITKDVSSLQQIKNNLKKYDIDYNDLIFSQCNLFSIYTQDGIENEEFKHVLSLI